MKLFSKCIRVSGKYILRSNLFLILVCTFIKYKVLSGLVESFTDIDTFRNFGLLSLRDASVQFVRGDHDQHETFRFPFHF